MSPPPTSTALLLLLVKIWVRLRMVLAGTSGGGHTATPLVRIKHVARLVYRIAHLVLQPGGEGPLVVLHLLQLLLVAVDGLLHGKALLPPQLLIPALELLGSQPVLGHVARVPG